MPPTRNQGAAELVSSATNEGGRPDYRVGALAKGLQVLSAFDEQHPTWTITDLAESTGFPIATVYRLVMTLVGEGYLDQLPTGEYRPSVRSLTLGSAALRSLDLVVIATPELERLGTKMGETVNLAVLDNDQILYLVRFCNSDLVTANIQVGSRLPATSTSIGKLLLAELADDDLNALVSPQSFVSATGPNAIRSLDELRRELSPIRQQGWAMQDEELSYGLRSVASPVRGADSRTIAGVNVAVQGREWSMQRLLGELLPALQTTCGKISMLIGGNSSD